MHATRCPVAECLPKRMLAGVLHTLLAQNETYPERINADVQPVIPWRNRTPRQTRPAGKPVGWQTSTNRHQRQNPPNRPGRSTQNAKNQQNDNAALARHTGSNIYTVIQQVFNALSMRAGRTADSVFERHIQNRSNHVKRYTGSIPHRHVGSPKEVHPPCARRFIGTPAYFQLHRTR